MRGSGANTRIIIALGLHSAAIIAFQLTLMQLISIVQWHHFAYMIISIAMLGFGASGTLLALARNRLLRAADWLVPALMTASGLCMIGAFQLTRMDIFQFDVYLLFVERSQFPILLANYLIFFVPFFTGALAIGILFIKHASQIGTYYFSNLLGSGLGGIALLLLLAHIHPQQLSPLVGMLSVFSGILSMRLSRLWLTTGLAVAASLLAIHIFRHEAHIPISQYKALAQTLNLPGAEIIHSRPGVHGLVQVVQSPALRFAPALSLGYTGPVPVKKNVFVNGDFYGVIPNYREDQEVHILDHTTQGLPYAIRSTPGRVLLINAGEGAPLAHVFSHDPGLVDAVVPNSGIVRLFREDFAEASGGLFLHERLNIHSMKARSFLATAGREAYDLIILPQQEAFGGSAGINALRENYSLTRESFALMWQHLKPGGIIVASTWMDYPSRSSLKLLATLVETAREQGIADPEVHLAAVRSWGTISFILKKTPLSEEENEKIRQFASERFFDILLLPGIQEEERQRFNMTEDEDFFTYVDKLVAGDTDFRRDYGFMIEPATDNRPYFSQFLRLRNIPHLSQIYGGQQLPFLELGYLIVMVTFVQSLVLALLFIVLPLFRLRKSLRKKGGTLLYFGALGIGYMFVEIILIQRFVLYFGHPVYALSAVISLMLIFSGMGSLSSNRLAAIPRATAGVGLIITAMLLFYTFFLTPLLQWSIAFPMPLKILISLLLIGIPSFFKGMMFPLGIRFLADYDAGQTPWAWGINGSISVISTSLAMLIAVEAGFMVVMAVAVSCYALASIVFGLHKRSFPR